MELGSVRIGSKAASDLDPLEYALEPRRARRYEVLSRAQDSACMDRGEVLALAHCRQLIFDGTMIVVQLAVKRDDAERGPVSIPSARPGSAKREERRE